MKISNTTPVSGISKSSSSQGKIDNAPGSKKEDKVEETIPGHDVRSALASASDVDMSEVNRIKKEISEGTLKMDSQQLAKAVLDLHRS